MKGGSIKRRRREIEEAIADHGGTLISTEYGKHLKFRFRTPWGAERLMTVSVTPSDWRTHAITRAKLRRMLDEEWDDHFKELDRNPKLLEIAND